jgi:hypothetical protein
MNTGNTLPDGPFPPLAAGLLQFQDRVTGTEGDYRDRLLVLSGQDGVVPEIALAVLDAIAMVLETLYEAMVRLAVFLLQADAAIALIAVYGAGLRGLAQALDREWPPGLARAGEVGAAIGTAGDALAQLDEVALPDLIPDPGDLKQIQAASLALVRHRIDPAEDPGSLELLIDELKQDGT